MRLPLPPDPAQKSSGRGMTRRVALRGLASCGGVVLLPRVGAASHHGDSVRYPACQAFIRGFVDRKALAGALAAIGKAQERAAFLGAGVQSLDAPTPVSADSLWRLYSMTKPITGIAAMVLIEERRMKLDQPIADFIPAFSRMQVLESPDGALSEVHPAKRQITVRQLLTHTSGLTYNAMQTGPIKRAYEDAGIIPALASRHAIPDFPLLAAAPDLATYADRLASLPLVHEPGTHWNYSVSFDLLGRLIEVASGQRLESFMKARIFQPLGMTSTWFRVPASEAHRLTSTYAISEGKLEPIDSANRSIYLDPPPLVLGGAGLVSSARDYDRFLMMLLGEGQAAGVRILRPETARLAMSNLIDDSVARQGTFIEGAGFGAGGRVSLASSRSGEGTFGWSGAAGTVGFVDRRRGYRAGAYAQYMPYTALPFEEKFADAFLRDVEG